jgi:hypothetical protein
VRGLYHVAEARGESRRVLALIRAVDTLRGTLGLSVSPGH